MHLAQLRIDQIRRDGGTQMREQLDQATVQEYAAAMRAGADFPAVRVFRDPEGRYWLVNGFHRVAAALEVGRKTILAEVFPGTQRDAILAACGVNHKHGLRRTNGDKRRAVLTLLRDPEWGDPTTCPKCKWEAAAQQVTQCPRCKALMWTSRRVAEQCGVSDFLVRTLRQELKKEAKLGCAASKSHPQESAEEPDPALQMAIAAACKRLRAALRQLEGQEGAEVDEARKAILRALELLGAGSEEAAAA